MTKYIQTVLSHGLVRDTLKVLHIEVEDEKGDELWALCPQHEKRTGKPDHKPSWSINTETGLHACFSCGYKGNLYTLVVDINGGAPAQHFWQDMDQRGTPVPEGWRVDRDFQIPKPDKLERFRPESDLALFVEPPADRMAAKGLWLASVKKYGVLWDSDAAAWILPFRDPDTGALIGYQQKFADVRRFINYPTGVSKANTLFGYHEVGDAGTVVLVESPLDAVMLDGLGFPAMAVSGSRLSDRQMELLQEFDMVVIAMDRDEAGEMENKRINRSETGFYYRMVDYRGDGKDFGEMDTASIESTLRPLADW